MKLCRWCLQRLGNGRAVHDDCQPAYDRLVPPPGTTPTADGLWGTPPAGSAARKRARKLEDPIAKAAYAAKSRNAQMQHRARQRAGL